MSLLSIEISARFHSNWATYCRIGYLSFKMMLMLTFSFSALLGDEWAFFSETFRNQYLTLLHPSPPLHLVMLSATILSLPQSTFYHFLHLSNPSHVRSELYAWKTRDSKMQITQDLEKVWPIWDATMGKGTSRANSVSTKITWQWSLQSVWRFLIGFTAGSRYFRINILIIGKRGYVHLFFSGE